MILRESVLGPTARSSPTILYRGVAQLVARMLWEHDVGCSSHLTPTSFNGKTACSGGFSAFWGKFQEGGLPSLLFRKSQQEESKPVPAEGVSNRQIPNQSLTGIT